MSRLVVPVYSVDYKCKKCGEEFNEIVTGEIKELECEECDNKYVYHISSKYLCEEEVKNVKTA